MKRVSKTLVGGILAILLCAAATARAQLVPDGGSVTINNITTNLSSGLTVGTNGANTTLSLINQGQVSSTSGTIGLNASSANNFVSIAGSGSAWNHGNSLAVGGAGSRNRLTISSGGQAFGTSGSIGSTSASDSNMVLVTGASSLWQPIATLMVGVGGRSNQLTIAAGGRVLDTAGYIGAGLGSRHNRVLVTDPGSAWNHTDILVVGLFGRSNQLHIANSASVTSSNSAIGFWYDAWQNQVLVSDGATWTNGGRLIVGSNSYSAQLIVTNGGRVFNGDLSMGYDPYSWFNQVVVTGPGSLLTNSVLAVGLFGSSNTLAISNSGLVAAQDGYIGRHSDGIARTLSSGNEVLVAGSGSRLSLNTLRVGNEGAGNRLTVSNGGRAAVAAFLTIGDSGDGDDNTVLVSGTSSSLTSMGTLTIGANGARNRLTISNGGGVTNAGFAYIGALNSASNNAVLVTDPGSRWTIGDAPAGVNHLYIGDRGGRNSLTISNGGTLASAVAWVGNGQQSASNTVLVTGAGSLWTNSDLLSVGSSGSGNHLTISNGARVASSRSIVGGYGANNSARVTGTGSLWANSSTLDVGFMGPQNEMLIDNQATVTVGSSLIVGTLFSSTLAVNLGGRLYVTNAARNAWLEVYHGRLISGTNALIITDKLVLTNGIGGLFFLDGGQVQTAGTVVQGYPFTVGNDVDNATFILNGGTHSFGNGLYIGSNATLRGCGTIEGPVINRGTIISDCPGGTLSFTGSFSNYEHTGSTIYSTNGGRLLFNAPLFRITQLTKTGTTASVSFTTIKALRFTLEYKNTLTNPNWTPILPGLTGNGAVLTRPDPNATAPTRFYRLSAE